MNLKAKKILAGAAAWLLAIVVLLSGCYKGHERFAPADHSIYDVAYASGVPGEEFLVLDIHFPEGAAGLPVIVYIHGGGWTEGDKSQMDVWSKRISNQGYVVFNVNYRLAPAYPFPAAVNDCLGALAWIKDHAEDYGGDPQRIGVTGGSAGGHLTAMVATAAGDDFWKPTGHEYADLKGAVKAQAPFFGVFDFAESDFIKLSGLNKKFLGGSLDEVPENYRLASPVSFVSENVPPTLLVCGRLDPIYNQSRLYYKSLQEAGAEAEFVTYPLQTHGFEINMHFKSSQDAFQKMMDFFRKHL